MTSLANHSDAQALLEIDLRAICDNWRSLRDRVAPAVCAGVVKADAYGLGADRVASALAAAGCRDFFVAHLDEGIALRNVLPADSRVYVLHGPSSGAAGALAAHGLIPVLNSLEQIAAWSSASRKAQRALPAVVHVDTGMARLGLSAHELAVLRDDPRRLDGIEVRLTMSHLVAAERQDAPVNALQLQRFKEARRVLRGPGSLANSSGIFLGAAYHFDLVRPGAALYGIAPVADQPSPMQQVVRLRAQVLQVRHVPAGTSVGYGPTWHAPTPRRIATVAAGYADGYARSLGNRASARFADTVLPLVGTVSMDTITLDATTLPQDALQPGSFVQLIHDDYPIDALARDANTIGYEMLTRLGRRYRRHYADA